MRCKMIIIMCCLNLLIFRLLWAEQGADLCRSNAVTELLLILSWLLLILMKVKVPELI